MNQKKNYDMWFKIAISFLVAAILIHVSGYITNALYILSWILWMPAIAMVLVAFFDLKNSSKSEKKKILSAKIFKSKYFVAVVIISLYVIVNTFASVLIISEVNDIQMKNDLYYAVTESGMKEISYDEYVRYSLASFRLLSGTMLPYISVLVMYYSERKKGK